MYANRLKHYLNQTAALERHTDADRYGNPGYLEPETIRVRKENAAKQITTASGETITAQTKIFASVEMKPMDKVDGYIVLHVGGLIDRNGNTIGFEAYLGASKTWNG